MRRPQQEAFQEDHHQRRHHHFLQRPGSSASIEPRQSNEKDESRLARVKRVLTGSLLGRSGNTGNYNRVFGARLELVESYLDTGVPYVVHRLCNYIEKYGFQSATLFRLSGGSPRLTERLRAAFERKGDADLEGAACPSTAATLLRQYLKELPQPLVPSSLVARLLHVHSQYADNRETWIEQTQQLLLSLPPSHYRLLGYLANYLSKYEAKHGRSSGVCGVFAPVVLPHVPPATTLLRDILTEASTLFSNCNKDSSAYVATIPNDCETCCKERKTEISDTNNSKSLLCALKPRKRKERRESCCQERKLIRSNSEEKILDNPTTLPESIRRVSSHEDFNSDKHLHIISRLNQDMGHGVRCTNLPLHERTNVSPVSTKPSPLPSPCDLLLITERPECDVEHVRSTERFSRSITPRGRRQPRRRRIHRGLETDTNSSKENEDEETDSSLIIDSPGPNRRNGISGQSFLEMLSSGPSRSPSPVRPPLLDLEDSNNPVPTNWIFPHRPSTEEEEEEENANERVEALTSPRNSLLIPRRFYTENDVPQNVPASTELGLKTLTKHINGLKKKIKKYEDEFEENFGYRPSHSDKMSNRDIKRLCVELNKLRKEHKMLKEDPIGLLKATANSKNNLDNSVGQINNINSPEKSRSMLMEEMLKDVERKLTEKRLKYGRPDNMEEMTHEQLLDEKTAVQKALLHIENAFGRPVSKEDRAVVRVLYDRYRTLKRLIIRAGANKNKDSISELATILEHEAMDFTSSSLPGNPIDTDRRASEPDMSHRGILDCIDPSDQLPTDSDSQHSSSEGSRGPGGESLHALPQEDLIAQQRVMREEKKRLRRALKELEAQFEARAGRKMQREDRGPHVTTIYESYKQTKAKLRLIDALLSKSA
ncbi:protein FAM13A isoform X2 [Chelonus insularis]|uniref:protein FAM13A isoform X2 n=1 Tax=Chelonus insularis TaxID=460826 RepID=UPI00158C9E54|nr:protein FAM13A isoform X2 [Chelonus insularis]